MYEFRIHLHYAFLTTDTDFYHFSFNVCTAIFARQFFILEINALTDLIAGVTSVGWSLCFWKIDDVLIGWHYCYD